jgi:hypothetical protein
MADNALKHAIYLSNISGAEIIILNVLEHLDSVDSSAPLVMASSKNSSFVRSLEVRSEGLLIVLKTPSLSYMNNKLYLCS